MSQTGKLLLNDSEYLKQVKAGVFAWKEFSPQRAHVLLNRLANSQVALSAWLSLRDLALQKLKLNTDISLETTVSYLIREIAGHVSSGGLSSRSAKTQNEITEAGVRAEVLALELLRLIEGNSTLDIDWERLLPDHVRAAYTRVMNGISIPHSIEIENELTELHQRAFPEFSDMTTTDAYRIMQHQIRNLFAFQLKRFAEFSRESANDLSVLPRPKSRSAAPHVMALVICSLLNRELGSPCIEITTAFVSAVFDDEIETETVKKWWQRRSQIGDDS